MSGNPANAAVWANADVFIGGLTAVIPMTVGPPALPSGAAFGVDWDFVGLLNGESGFGEQRALDSTDHFAWGSILVATTRRNFKLTRTFTALEDNEVVLGLTYPGSTLTYDTDGYAGDLKVPDTSHKFKIAFEVASGNVIKRVISKNYAQVEEVGEATESETTMATKPITVAIYPDESGILFHTYKGPRE